jgi:hypothetical protein
MRLGETNGRVRDGAGAALLAMTESPLFGYQSVTKACCCAARCGARSQAERSQVLLSTTPNERSWRQLLGRLHLYHQLVQKVWLARATAS